MQVQILPLGTQVQFILESEDQGKSKSKLAQGLNEALSTHRPIVILLNDATALRHPLQQALPKPLASSGCTRAMVIFALELAFGLWPL